MLTALVEANAATHDQKYSITLALFVFAIALEVVATL